MKAKTLKQLGIKKFLAALVEPEGFTKEIYEEPPWNPHKDKPVPAVKFKTAASGDIEIKIVMYPMTRNDWQPVGIGHTSFDTAKGRRTFDRRGVDDSFYVDRTATPESVAETLAEQIKRIAESRERLARSSTVPELGYNLTPEELESHRKSLRIGQRIQMAPAGFGTGHILQARRSSRFAIPASDAICNFFGVGQLFIETFDHD